MIAGLQVSAAGLERAVRDYCEAGRFETAFDLKLVPVSSRPLTALPPRRRSPGTGVAVDTAPPPGAPAAAAQRPSAAVADDRKTTRQDAYAGKGLFVKII